MNSISVSNKSWILKKFNENQLTYLKDNFSLDEITSKLLSIRNIKNEEVVGFLNPSIKNFLPNPENLIDMKKYGLQDVNKVKVENTYISKFKEVWKDILNVINDTNIDHVKIAEIFNLKYNIDSKKTLIENL